VEHLTQLKTLCQAQGECKPGFLQGSLAIHSARGQNQDNLEGAKQPAILQRRGQFISIQSAGKAQQMTRTHCTHIFDVKFKRMCKS